MHTIEAVYEDGVFRPLGEVQCKEHERVRITIEVADRTHSASWLDAVRDFQRQVIANHGVLPDSTADIANDRRRHE
jgi:predicted DNA-binding antitoxin AbrB/MazE fold protein